ncbi:Transcriptional regulator, AraC family [Pseudonocardia sp. Ae168_Ps1]|uniref:GlxA family transcriptional regulator n=1 Tax=unclassified Pseudonocardia TaxID=2619320 RepID=UPI00094B36C6|nr:MULTISPECIES: helix-turn-helix domain-containing protein [unclassified Pseudonocardia]OLL74818.1 Transcriptional regulator, AraC family [Pseudonocardia sp. Ae150A_Ps1]OLL80810.1 Transcriptional regulator, AraC family [Pseudonocardia sp. Ae168_Ps1]OLL85072.1 Transcriptional regulator, AraC family [Pseudonocardia sp. Ae263_Ps1]OLL94911.1 Transcriptional regulator, AraC family [Pseudonocardia sp. Ae356_Ps1]
MEERAVLVVVYDGVEPLDVTSVTSTLTMANRHRARPPYRVTVVGLDGPVVPCDGGIELVARTRLADWDEPVDTVVVSGGTGHTVAAGDRAALHHLRRVAGAARRTASVCTGATLLAAAGLLDDRTATTHWRFAAELAARFPRVTVDPDPIFLRDGDVATSGGVTSALDLTLSFVEEDHGSELARRVSRELVTYLQRPGDQAQASMFTSAPRTDDALVRGLLEHATAHPGDDLGAGALADRAGVSTRQLNRLFAAGLGDSPARVVRRIRVEAAAQLLATTDLPLSQVARRSGLGSAETLRTAFTDRYGLSPSRFRATRRRQAPPGQAPSDQDQGRAERVAQ